MRSKYIHRALIVILVFSFFKTKAQTYSNKPSSILSFSIGMTSSNLYQDTINYRSGTLFYAGFTYSLMINDRLNVAIDLAGTGKAFKISSPIIKFRSYFVDVPVYAQIKMGESFRLNIGAQCSFATNTNMISIDAAKANGVRIDPVANPVAVDYGILGGLEFDITKSIGLGARYTMSALPVVSRDPGFGVFQLCVKYSPIKTHKVFFGKNKTQQ